MKAVRLIFFLSGVVAWVVRRFGGGRISTSESSSEAEGDGGSVK
jgi:hypothetical protein